MARSVLSDLQRIFTSGVSAVLPQNLVRNALKYNQVNDHLEVFGKKYDLTNKTLYVIGMGKAVKCMANEVKNILNSKIKQGIISIPDGNTKDITKVKNMHYYEGARNNLPDSQAESTAQKVKDLITKLGHNDFLLVLISGGGSALLPMPKKTITLEEKTKLIKKLANAGADIKELNIVRKCISDLKGGQLAIYAQPARVVSLILSDIVDDPLDLIASGPTVESKGNQSDALNVIKKYKLLNNIPVSIRNILEKNTPMKLFPKDNVDNFIIGSNKISIAAAVNEAERLNYIATSLSNSVTGSVNDVSKKYVLLTKTICNFFSNYIDLQEFKHKVRSINLVGTDLNFVDKIKEFNHGNKEGLCMIFGGETTVEVTGCGKGGRNQQMALEFSKAIHQFKTELTGYDIYFLSAGTDGIDGPTDAAGAIGYLELFSDAKKVNIDVQNYINDNDSYNFFNKFQNGDLHVITGHTNTNVMDMQIIVIKKVENY